MIDRSRGRFCLKFGSWLWGVERSRVIISGCPYLDRWILYLGRWGFRLHKFYRGDDDTAPHDHPFWFITIPLTHNYAEWVYGDDDWKLAAVEGKGPYFYHDVQTGQRFNCRIWNPKLGIVRRWRPHFRPASFRHIVVCPIKHAGKAMMYIGLPLRDRWEIDYPIKPFWTLCIFGFVNPDWGFWPSPAEKVHWTKFKTPNRDGASYAVAN